MMVVVPPAIADRVPKEVVSRTFRETLEQIFTNQNNSHRHYDLAHQICLIRLDARGHLFLLAAQF